MASLFASAVVSFSLLFACSELVDGHAVLLEPPSRNYVANRAGQENCAHCLQSGGPDAVKARGTGVWPTVLEPSSHGICGDPVQGKSDPAGLSSSPYMIPTEVQRTYKAGEVVEFRIGINAHHQGHYEFRICDVAVDGRQLSSAQEGQECLNKWVLQRAPLDSTCGAGNSKADCQPIDVKHPGRWYLPPQQQGTMVAGPDFNDEGVPSSVTEYHVMKYKIPDGLSCTHCTLQWYWSTGNNCLYDADYLGPDGYFQRNAAGFQALGWKAEEWCAFCVANWATCDNSCCKTGGRFGEEFWNCADIAVTASDAGSGDAPTPGPSPTTTPVASTATTSAPTTTPSTTQAGGGSRCNARPGNIFGATDAKCADVCGVAGSFAAGQWWWPCDAEGPCSCSSSPTVSTTAATSTTSAAAATTPEPASGSCSAVFAQCGGSKWSGPTCCTSGHKCSFQNEWYSQCIPQ